jgi:hypothetical protein
MLGRPVVRERKGEKFRQGNEIDRNVEQLDGGRCRLKWGANPELLRAEALLISGSPQRGCLLNGGGQLVGNHSSAAEFYGSA